MTTIVEYLKNLSRTRLAIHVAVCVCLVVGLERLVATTPISSDCKKAASPIIDAIERYRRLYGHYPNDLNALVSERMLYAIPRMPLALGHTREGYSFKADLSEDSYMLYYFEGNLLADPYGFFYPSVVEEWMLGAYPDYIRALDLAVQKFLADRSSRRLTAFVLILKQMKAFTWKNAAKFMQNGQPCVIEGLPAVSLKAGDAEAVEYGFVFDNEDVNGEIVGRINAIYQRDTKGAESTWRKVPLTR